MAHPLQKLITALLIAALSLQPAACSTVSTGQEPAKGGTVVDIAPEDGWISFHAVPVWSNGESPEWFLSFQPDRSNGYLLFAYEFGPGLVPVTFKKVTGKNPWQPRPDGVSGDGEQQKG